MTSLALSEGRLPGVRRAAALLRSHPLESAGAGLLFIAACASAAAVSNPHPSLSSESDKAVQTAPAVQDFNPFAVRQVAPDEALKANAAVPLASGPNPAAAPFYLKTDDKTYARALQCLSQAIYYEAAREPEEGQRAVAQVVLNRVRHPAYPASICGVVYQGAERPTGCQFSFTCDGSLARAPMKEYWDRARRIADEALRGRVAPEVGNATHYHANYVLPYWAPTLVKNAVLGAHIFYRWPGAWGQASSFNQKWGKRESDPWALRSAALAAEARYAAMQPTDPAALAKQELPPELSKLVESEIGPNGQKRVSVTLTPAARVERNKQDMEKLQRVLDQAKASTSTSLSWGLTGDTKGTEEQAPLGRKQVSEAASSTAPATAEN